ncbi:MAG: ribosome biogenesis GTP-binding protein YsxC [Deltaproteobacteria bacterium]|nr:ribosome biogenesis GTP-binding protein YsxC [Deltaproteobacteria bacterium]MBK8237878.1 ribosome biogenesis GTP-binding protein YsxC [Deltaproteobacteria bacterium]MBP7291512.1 ribosome biogenesis GTP-binding protein YsxC [Nannocystaceae bacterium]
MNDESDHARANWRVSSASFESSAPKLALLPPADRPEFAVAGRSNVGKSSLLNAMSNQVGLARVSRSPGRTQLLNAFAWGLHGPGDATAQIRCVDLPGYGFAKVNAKIRDGFGPMVEEYLLQRESLRAVLVLVDVRREIDDRDLSLFEFLADRPLRTYMVGTKADKLGAAARGVWIDRVVQASGLPKARVLLTAARTGLGVVGRRSVLETLVRALEVPR